jgi:hypothetical protein
MFVCCVATRLFVSTCGDDDEHIGTHDEGWDDGTLLKAQGRVIHVQYEQIEQYQKAERQNTAMSSLQIHAEATVRVDQMK